jgi:predicted DsbA family dithiol-disulfide isomerase
MAGVLITEFTDPGCPFAYSAEPFRWRLKWRYGDQIEWRLRMVVLADTPEDYLSKGFDTTRMAAAYASLAREHGMPIDTRERPRVHATRPACGAVVAARRHAPDREWLLLRALRVRHFTGELLDESATIAAAAADAGIDAALLDIDDAALEEDKAAARNPTPAALALDHKLAAWEGGRRYTCPSYELEAGDARISVPGFQPYAAYEVALANLLPGAELRAAPESVEEVLRWAGVPLASREVAELCGLDVPAAREALGRVATERHVGADGFWSMP